MSDHLTDEQVNDVIDARLGLEARQSAMDHLDHCDDCRLTVNRIATVINLAATLQLPVEPSRDLWPALSHRTVHARAIRGPWLFTLIFAVLVISATSVWLERTRPWERVATEVVAEPEYQASDAEILRMLATLEGSVSDATKRKELDRLAASVFRSSSQPVRLRFFRSVEGIQSDGEKRRLLLLLLSNADDTVTTAAFIEAARTIGSTAQRAEVLAALAGQPSMGNAALRLRYLDAVEEIPGARDRAHARSALLSP